MKVIRAGAVIFKEDSVALLECEYEGHAIYTFPGGRMEPRDGTVEQTVVREVWEELGLKVRPTRLVATFEDERARHYYFAVEILGGKFGKGKGPEFHSWAARCGKVRFQALWVPIEKLARKDVRPRPLAEALPLLLAGQSGEPIRIYAGERKIAVNG